MNNSIRTLIGAGLGIALGFAISSYRTPVTAQAISVGAAGEYDITQLPAGLQAVALTNGAVYIGVFAGIENGMPVLKNVYYVHCEVDKNSKVVNNVLVKRGKEWHGPDKMLLNPKHILLMEPVSTNSRVAELVRAAKD